MVKMSKKIALICTVAAVFCTVPYSIEVSRSSGATVVADQAQARVGRPLTPVSVAGVARRSARRTVRRHAYYGHHHHPHY
jgi:hypothetical protein